MLAHEVMTSPVITAAAEMAVPVAAALLLEYGVTAAPVLDSAGGLVGIVSVLDLIKRELEPDPRAHEVTSVFDGSPLPRLVQDVMTTDVIAVPASADICDVVAVMVDERVTSVPVTSGRTVVGMISRRDVLRMLLRSDEVICGEVARRVAEAVGERAGVVHVTAGEVSISGSGDPRCDLLAQLAARTVPGVLRVRVTAPAQG